jgi:hypothetical protein
MRRFTVGEMTCATICWFGMRVSEENNSNAHGPIYITNDIHTKWIFTRDGCIVPRKDTDSDSLLFGYSPFGVAFICM